MLEDKLVREMTDMADRVWAAAFAISLGEGDAVSKAYEYACFVTIQYKTEHRLRHSRLGSV